MKKILSIYVLLLVIFNYSTVNAQGNRVPAKGLAVSSPHGNFFSYEFARHAVGDNDVQIEILYAGICHSDLHMVEGKTTSDPLVPGHEIAGRVIAVGKNVTKFKVGELAGVGCMVNSCHHCSACEVNHEQFCENGPVFTYGFPDKYHDNEITQGGYSNNIVVSEEFVLHIPEDADLKKVAPLFCAGTTTYSPIHFSHVKAGDKVGVAGFGGLGHMAVQYLIKLGAEVTVFDITEEKRNDAKRLGAIRYVNVNNPDELKGLNNTLDFVMTTIPYDYDPMIYVNMLKFGGEMAIIGLPRNSTINIAALVWSAGRKVYGTFIGGIKETQEMLDYSVENNIYPEVEVINADPAEIDKAYKNVADGKVKFRYVIDMSTIK